MPILKRKLVVRVHGFEVFLNLEAGITRSEASEATEQQEAPARPRPQPAARPAGRYPRVERGTPRPKPEGKPEPAGGTVGANLNDTGMKPENLIFLFGYGRPASTWLIRMLQDLNHSVWSEPRFGENLGQPQRAGTKARAKNRPSASVRPASGSNGSVSPGSIRSLVLSSANSRFPSARKDAGTVIIKEGQSAVGAPLLMEALPESRMIVLVRDPRDVVAAQALDGESRTRKREHPGKRKTGAPAAEEREFSAQALARGYRREIERAKQAYEVHKGPKVVVRYEDLRADTPGELQRIYSALGLEIGERDLTRAVDKYAFENMPEDKGRGKFHRRATPGIWKETLTEQQAKAVEGETAPMLDEFYPDTERVLRV